MSPDEGTIKRHIPSSGKRNYDRFSGKPDAASLPVGRRMERLIS
jgi:hypothetical protein